LLASLVTNESALKPQTIAGILDEYEAIHSYYCIWRKRRYQLAVAQTTAIELARATSPLKISTAQALFAANLEGLFGPQ